MNWTARVISVAENFPMGRRCRGQ